MEKDISTNYPGAITVVDADYVLDTLAGNTDIADEIIIVDVRPAEYRQNGFIPTSISIPTTDSLDKQSPNVHLSLRYKDAGFKEDDPILIYCQDGQLALMAAEMIASEGFNNIYLYYGSFQDWISDDSRPVAY